MATRKQKLVANIILENPGTSVSAAMREAGYGEGAAKNPQDLTRSKGWKDLMEEWLPNDLLLQRHNQIIRKANNSDANKGLDLAYKLKGAYAPERNVNVNVEADLAPELTALAEKLNSA